MVKKSDTFKIEWEAHEYAHKERGHDWFWAVGIVTLAIALTSVILGNIIFAILVLTAVFALALFINRPPEIIHASVNEQGVNRGNMHYPYETLDSFWLDEDHPFPKIILKSKKLFMPLIIVPLGTEVDAVKVNDALSRFLKEEYHPLPFVEKVLEYLGF